MLLFYVDECGGHTLNATTNEEGQPVLKEGASPFFVLSGVGVRDSSRRPIAEALFELKQRHFGSAASDLPWGDTEIKGRHLFRASRSVAAGKVLEHPAGYKALDTQAKVARFITDLGLLYDKYRPLTFTVAIDKTVLVRSNPEKVIPPLGAAYAYLQQRIALTLERLYAGESAILIADQQTQHEAFFRSGQMNQARDRLSAPLPVKPNFDLVVDKPLWVDTDLSSWDRELIQLADMVAYTTAACMQDGKAPSRDCYLWPQMRRTLALNWSTGRVRGGGFSVFPKQGAYPDFEGQ